MTYGEIIIDDEGYLSDNALRRCIATGYKERTVGGGGMKGGRG